MEQHANALITIVRVGSYKQFLDYINLMLQLYDYNVKFKLQLSRKQNGTIVGTIFQATSGLKARSTTKKNSYR